MDAFTIRLRVQAERCGFEDKVDENIKDQIIQNCQSAILRRDLLKRGDVSLEEVLSMAKIFETVAQKEKSFTNEATIKPHVSDVNEVNVVPHFGKRARFSESRQSGCYRCGYMGHLAKDDKCPAKGKACNKCGGRNHFAIKCRSKQLNRVDRFRRPENWRTSKTDGKDGDSHIVKHVDDSSIGNKTEYIFHVSPCDEDNELQCEIGGVSVIVSNQRREISKVFKAYGGQPLLLVGAFSATLKLGNVSDETNFYVIKGNGKILIGRDTATYMGVLRISVPVNEIEANGSCKLGTIKDIVVDIPIRTDIVPVAQPYRRIPVALEKLVDRKIDDLLSKGIIEPVNEPAKWISPVVVVPKGDGSDVRICVDMRRANEAVERENHPLPTFEDFLPHLAKAKVFSRLDIESAFHQVEISQKSREITTFITRRGLFRYTRLMFGINCAPELFQKTMEQVLS
ncbi:uncharacterized protein K02A2.6-like [Toxorhynchites rutilus septentrionalis]|uniref:uncharacterized protein K02A2.6-like n=1 Tax=Toxorhynchites rutilus septentrionalis TaxID=329112 RepID=UPI00247957B4|nr:uncharacterized protein K02A2.6-like [Toxorhynchites rutilus septentrionalis]